MPLNNRNWEKYRANDEPICPHCDAPYVYSLPAIDQDTVIVKCVECRLYFTINIHVNYSFSTEDNLNGGNNESTVEQI